MKPGTTIATASTTAVSRAVSVPFGAAAAENVRLSGKIYGHCAAPPGEDCAGYRDDGEHPGAALSTPDQEHEAAYSAQNAEDNQRQRPGCEAMEQIRRVGAEYEDTDQPEDGDDGACRQRPPAEVIDHQGVAETPGVPKTR